MIRIGFIGLGYRGRYLLKLLTSMPDLVDVVALADPSPEEDLRQGSWCIYDKGRDDYRRMIDTEGLYLVVI
ncbi:MAG: Gfo/Idh/MocA family protein, partial [Porphyromonas sp.]